MGRLGDLVRRARGQLIQIKTDDELRAMRRAGLVVADALDAVRAAAAAGRSTWDLDKVAEQVIRDHGATPSFLGYQGFPASICASVNEQVVHGIPNPEQVLADGDLVSIDCGAALDGWHGDSAITFGIGELTEPEQRLLTATEDSMWAGIAAGRAGCRLTDISHAVEACIERWGDEHGWDYGIVEQYGGHGIGSQMHQDPHILNYGEAGQGPRLRAGMAFAIEPMITLGSPDTDELDDGWTVVTTDGSRAAHFEHTYAVTASGPWVLTARDGGAAALGARGVQTGALD